MGTAVTAGVIANAAAIGLTATSAWLITTAATQPPVLTLMVAIVAVRAFGIARGVVRYVERLVGHDAVLRRLVERRALMMRALARIGPAGLPELRSGDLVSRLVDDVDAAVDEVLRARLPYATAVVVGVLAGLGAAAIDAGAAAGLAVSLLVAIVLAPAIARRLATGAEAATSAAKGAYATAVTQALHGSAEIVAFGAVDATVARLDRTQAEVVALARRSAYGQGVAIALASAAAGAASWWALHAGVPDTHVRPALLAVLVLAPMALHDVIAPLAPAIAALPRWQASAARVDEVLGRPSAMPDPEQPVGAPGRPYTLVLSELSVGWSQRDAFRGLNLLVPAGGRVAILGRSGAGKSTLAATLLGFLRPRGGLISIGGVDITTMAGDDLRRIVGVCAQDAYVFDSTIAENIRLARPDASDGEIGDVLQRAGLDLDPSTPVGEHGTRLSGGQRQRISLARLLLADRPIVVFDEPTEHLDDASAEAVTRDLLSRADGRTVLLFTHRRHGLDLVDEVVDLDVDLSVRSATAGRSVYRTRNLV
jgi:thiol reductant ABC exporter CydC subunit